MGITKSGITKTAVGVGVAGILAISGVKEHTRGEVSETLEHLGEAHATKVKQKRNDPKLSENQRTLVIQIQARIRTLGGNIENNKQLHGFFGIPWRKLPLFDDTNTRLKKIQEKLQTTDDENELTKIEAELKQLMIEFHVLMKKDEEEILEELDDGISYISYGDIANIQSYMRECLGIIKQELTVRDISADYTATNGSELDGMIEEFINETDEKKSKKTLKKLVNHYRDLYAGEDSKLAFHHLTEISQELESGDSWKEWSSRWVIIAICVVLSAMAIKKYALPTIIKVGKRGIKGLGMVAVFEYLDYREKKKKKKAKPSVNSSQRETPVVAVAGEELATNEAVGEGDSNSDGTK